MSYINKITLLACLVTLTTSCTTSFRRGFEAFVYADKTYKCTGGNMVFRLEGAAEFQKGYIQVNNSDRVLTLYQDYGVESQWFWGAKVNNSSTVFDIEKPHYILVVEASGAGVYLNSEKGSEVSLSCGALND